MCGGCSGAIWLSSHHHPGGCCTLVVVEEIPSFYVKCFEYPEKHYINVTNYYYYYKYLPFFFSPVFVTLKGFIIGKFVWLYCSDNLQKSKTSMTKNRDKIVNRDIKKKNSDIIYFFHIAHPYLLHNVIKLRLCYGFENATFSGKNLHIVPLILNNFFVICRLILIDLNPTIIMLFNPVCLTSAEHPRSYLVEMLGTKQQ